MNDRKARKAKELTYFISLTCKCGKPKQRTHWFCQDCWEVMATTAEYEALLNVCDLYIGAWVRVFDKWQEIEGNKAST